MEHDNNDNNKIYSQYVIKEDAVFSERYDTWQKRSGPLQIGMQPVSQTE